MAQELAEFSKAMTNAISSENELQTANRSAVLAARQAADASTNNRDTIQSLLDNEVAFLNTLIEINAKLSAFQLEALKIMTAPSVELARSGQMAISAAADALAGYRDFGDGFLADDLDGISAIADPNTGLAHSRIQSLQANETARQTADATAEAVLKIAGLASLRVIASQTAITDRVNTIAQDAKEVKGNLKTLGGLACVFILVALVLNHALIVRPLNKISLTTERLSQGDMNPVVGFDRASDEIARIAKALTVFRDGLVEKQVLTRLADEERAESQAQQTAAVNAIGTGLAHLSKGDLTYRIEDNLTEDSVQLKGDLNSAVRTLNLTVVDVASVAESIRNWSAEINQAADDLAPRTASQATALEETNAASHLLSSNAEKLASLTTGFTVSAPPPSENTVTKLSGWDLDGFANVIWSGTGPETRIKQASMPFYWL